MREPLLQLGSALGRFGSNFGRIASRLPVFNTLMHHHHLVPVLLNILGSRRYLGFSEVQRGGNIRTRPPGFEVVEDIPDGDPCACNTVVHDHRYTYSFNPLGPKLTLPLDPHKPSAHQAGTDVAVAHPGPDGSQQHAGTPLYPYFGVKALGDRGV